MGHRGDFGETRGFFGETLPKKWLVEPIEFCNYIYVIYIGRLFFKEKPPYIVLQGFLNIYKTKKEGRTVYVLP